MGVWQRKCTKTESGEGNCLSNNPDVILKKHLCIAWYRGKEDGK